MAKKKKKQKTLDDKIKKSIKTMDVILIIVGIILVAFTTMMILLHLWTGSIPDTLCTCVFATLGCECGVMGWIKTNKNKYYNRELNKENGRPTDEIPDGPVDAPGNNFEEFESVENNIDLEEEDLDE